MTEGKQMRKVHKAAGEAPEGRSDQLIVLYESER